MAERLFNAPLGFEDDNGVATLSGSGVPGGDSSHEDAAKRGSTYSDIVTGSKYRKTADGAGAGNWERIPELADITGISNTDPWREPARVYTTDLQATVLSDINTDDIIQGVTVVSGDRILINDGSASPNVYIVGGSTGAWTLTEDPNNETAGDTVKILEGDFAGNEYTYNGTIWIWTDHNVGSEDSFQNAFMGKSLVGSELPSYTSTNYVANNDALNTAISKIDTQVGLNTTAIGNNSTAIGTNTTDISNLQTEVNDTQTGAGLGANGSYTANGSANYISTATSLKDADDKLDAQLKIATDNAGNAQTEIDAIELTIGGMINTDGTANSTALNALGNVTGASDLEDVFTQLDSAITTNASDISDNTTNISAIETSIGSLVNSSGVYVPNTGTTYLNGNASITEDLEDLDSAINTVANTAGSLQTEVDAIETAMGAVLDGNGSYVPHTGTNVLNGNTNITQDLLDLDTAVGTNTSDISNLQTEVDNIETASGGIFSGTGTFSGTGLDALGNITASTSLLNGISQLDTAITTNGNAIGSLDYSSNFYVTDTNDLTTAIGDLDTAVKGIADSLGATVVDSSASGATTHNLDSVNVDSFLAAKWLVVVTDEVTGNREAIEIFALHDGTGVADATDVDWSRYAKQKMGGNVAGFTIDVTLNGTGPSQEMRLSLTATNNITVSATRLSA